MRLTNQEHLAIKETIFTFDPQALIYLFGSRADDQKHGGDIDILVLSKVINERDRRKIRLKLFERIGEQKIDLVIASDTEKPFVKIAISQGVLL